MTPGVAALCVSGACALLGCQGAPAREITTVTVAPSASRDGADARAADGGSTGPRSVLSRTPEGKLTFVTLEAGADAGDPAVVCELGARAVLRKLTNERAVLARLEGAGSAPQLYVKIDAASAPVGEDARRAGLASTGAAPQTIAGDVATVRLEAAALCTLLRLPWVASVEPPGFALPR